MTPTSGRLLVRQFTTNLRCIILAANSKIRQARVSLELQIAGSPTKTAVFSVINENFHGLSTGSTIILNEVSTLNQLIHSVMMQYSPIGF